MAGQAGWYPAPGEEGLLRYWDGATWTNHRQPRPDQVPAAPAEAVTPIEPELADDAPLDDASIEPTPADPEPVAVAISASTADAPVLTDPSASGMSATELAIIEFEKQFERQEAEAFAHAGTQPQAPSFGVDASTPDAPVVPALDKSASEASAPTFGDMPLDAPAPTLDAPAAPTPESSITDAPAVSASTVEPPSLDARTFAAPAPAPAPAGSQSRFAPPSLLNAPAPTLHDPIPGPLVGGVTDMWNLVSEDDGIDAPTQARPTSASNKPVAKGRPAAQAKRKKGMSGGARGILIGILVILIGAGAIAYLTFQTSAAAGQAIANGIVTDLGVSTSAGASTCAPVAEFAVGGHSYTASTSVPVTSCPIQLGQSVSVIYDAAAPTTSGRIQIPSPFGLLVWLIPLTGLVIVIASLIAFMRSRSKAAPIS